MIAPRRDPVYLSQDVSASGIRKVIELLVKHQMANHWSGMGSVHNKAPGILDLSLQHLGTIDDYQLPAWIAIRNYLEPVRQALGSGNGGMLR